MHGEYIITVMYYYCVNKFHESVHTTYTSYSQFTEYRVGHKKQTKIDPRMIIFYIHLQAIYIGVSEVRILNQIIDNYLILIYL